MGDIRALLITDIVDSTALSEALGDGAAAALWGAHDRLARDLIRGWRGREIDKSDGLLILFDTAADAVGYALAYHRAMATLPVPVKARAGLHVGPVMLRENSAADVALGAKPLEVEGLGKAMAARVASVALGGQTLMTAVAKQALGQAQMRLQSHGHWRMKGIAEPLELFEVGEATAPFEPPPDGTKVHRVVRRGERWVPVVKLPNNLPQELTSFIGRERELAEVRDLLDHTKLVTLTGMGGLGKTRLLLQAAGDAMPDFPDGVWLVELAPLTDERLVWKAVAASLAIEEEPGRALLDALSDAVRDRWLLLVLDNCEHLIDACAALVAQLLRAGAHLKVIASSRERLRVAGEQVYPVPPLRLPDPQRDLGVEALMNCEAVRLFAERAKAARPDFSLTPDSARAVVGICRRLDGIPLAIELASARLRSMSVAELDRRLDQRLRLLTGGPRDGLARQQTLRSTIDWSHDLLDDAEKALLRRLAVFAGGWWLEAAQSTCCGEPVASQDVLDLLGSLIDKSLVVAQERSGSSRFRLLETMREYALEQLRNRNEAAAFQDRHLAYFLDLAETAEPEFRGSEQQAWMERLEGEHDNLRAALVWSCSPGGRMAEALRLAGALSRFWYVHGHLDEGRRWLATVIAAEPDGQVPPARANALFGAGALAWLQGNHPAAEALHEQALAIRRALDDRPGIAGSLNSLGLLARDQGRHAAARERLGESMAIFEALGDRRGIQTTLNNLGLLLKDQGDHAAARELIEKSLALSRQLSNRHGVAVALINLGNVASDLGDYDAAKTHYKEGLRLARELGDRLIVAASLNNLGNAACLQGDYPGARAMHAEGLAIRRELGARQGLADSLEGFANILKGEGDAARAATVLGAVERLREDIGTPVLPGRRDRYERDVAAARTALGDDAAFERAWQKGRAMTIEQAIEQAIDGHGD